MNTKQKPRKEYKGAFPEITLKYKKGDAKKFKVTNSRVGAEVVREIMNEDTLELQEEFVVIFLNNANNSIGWMRLSVGGMTGTLVDIRLLFVTALKCGAVSIIIAHNHPSGSLKPSKSDLSLTNKIKEGGEFLDIKLLDHFIITKESYYSFSDECKL
jgi:DNA repair protein RadC